MTNWDDKSMTESTSVVLRFPIKIGEPSLLAGRVSPDLNFRGKTLKSNVRQPCFAYALSLKACNLDLLRGAQVDLFSLGGEWVESELPTMTPADAIAFEGNYTGVIPPEMKAGDEFVLEITIDGVGSFELCEPQGPEPKGTRYEERLRKIDPNRGSEIKIEEYAFGMEFELTLGRKCRLEGRARPDVEFRISSIVANVPCPSFARASFIQVANVGCVGVGGPAGAHVFSLIERPLPEEGDEMIKVPPPAHVEGLPTVTCKSGAIDLWNFRMGKGVVDLPTLSPGNSVGFSGFYDGKVPAGYTKGEVFRLSIMFAGSATLAGSR